MGIYIKGNIEPPPHCFNCSEKIDPETRRCNIDGHLFEETLGKLTSRRDEDCPIVEVPPHGRLVDQDVLHDAIKAERFSKDALFFAADHEDRIEKKAVNEGLLKAMICVNNAPAIIPAEEES